ncbi:MAG: CoB--CoM heterodisulfide reductase iron-sulfur subunit A family protein [Desulfobacterota bacterium]|nr:CoB--CoM heterodisulfide reductase iron-sulfur subunit A family protein [Thermodesulfobacteriota bacterium]MDW8002334.1 CoB--CoM heterodisulfide reductase iron-sulfur subunit A family protein [Deltaproteobacteria bacterium]
MKVGIFICHCGHNIKGSVDVEKLRDYFKSLPHVGVSIDYTFLCSEVGQDLMKEAILKNGIDRVIVAACAPSFHSELFKDVLRSSGLNPYMLKRISIREHCSWVGEDIKGNTDKAKRLIIAGLYSVWHSVPREEMRSETLKSCLIIGGGVSGLSAASFLTKMGIKVYLVEKEKELGGNLKIIRQVWPTKKSGKEIIGEILLEIEKDNFEIFTETEIEGIEGYLGNYTVTLIKHGQKRSVSVGGIIVACGFVPFDPKDKLGIPYGHDERILTTVDLEKEEGKIEADGSLKIAILHCVGSRDERVGRVYCSRICCMNALKAAYELKEKYPDARIECFYMDVRAHPKGGEEFYEEVQRKGVIFTRSNVSEIISTKSGVLIRGEDTLSGEIFERLFDLVILSVGIGPREDAKRISQLLKIPLDKDGFFLEAHAKLRPFETPLKGIYISGCSSGPKDVEESINHGRAAALKVFSLINQGFVSIEPYIAKVNEKRCSGCRMCEEVCVAKAIVYESTKRVRVEEAQCMGCGLCASQCPSSAITLEGYSDRELADEISGLVEKGWEELWKVA